MSEQSYHRPNQQFDKTVLRIISDRLKTKAEELLAEEKADLRPGRSTVEQIFNSRVIIYNFVDFK